MTPQERRAVLDQVDAGRRSASRVLQLLDLGLDAADVVREVSPNLTPIAARAAEDIARLALFDHAALALVLAGLVDDSVLDGLEIPAAPARPVRPPVDLIVEALLLPGEGDPR